MEFLFYGMLKQEGRASGASSYLSWLMVGIGAALMLIWPIQHTIALRNFLLFTGGVIGLAYVVREHSLLYHKLALPILFLLLFFVWLLVHYLFFSHNQQLELLQIRGTWLRALFASLLGVGTGLFVRNHRSAQITVLLGILLFFLYVYLDYAWVGFSSHIWSIPYRFDLGFFGYKNTAVFYGITALALACGVISYQLEPTTKNNTPMMYLAIISVALIFLMFVITGTKNGVVVGLALILGIFGSFLKRTRKSWKNISIAVTLLVSISAMTFWHLRLTPAWATMLPSVETGMQIDRYANWKDPLTYGLPKLADGTVLNESPYLRAAWATAGFKLLQENLLGFGLYDKSFRYLADERLLLPSQSTIVATHCGWLDLALGLGVPGLLLVWAALALAFISSFRQKSLWAFVVRWVVAGIFIVWMLDEICNNHYIETLFYLIALLTAGGLPSSRDSANSGSD